MKQIPGKIIAIVGSLAASAAIAAFDASICHEPVSTHDSL